MKERFRHAAVVLLLMVFITACASPAASGETPPASSAQVATMVSQTLQALATPEVAATSTNVPEPSANLLPHSLFFLGKDNGWISQIYRIERDGRTKTQLTFEPTSVTDYDVSAADGSVAYVLENQLLLMNADGSNRRVVLDGGSRENNPWVTRPLFSRDGRLLAYGRDGLNLHDVLTGASSLVLPNQYGEPLPNGALFPIESYEPVSYSPDGTKLLLALGHWEQAPAHGVYELATNTLVHYTPVEDYIYCCSFHGGPAWAPDSSSFYGVASVHDTIYQSGELWKVDAGNGALTRLLKTDEGIMNLPKEVFLAPDGHLYFFFGPFSTDSGYFEPPVLELVRSGPDGVTDRTVLREENFRLMTEALWAPDASLVVVATVPERRWDQGVGVLELYPTNGQQESVWLASYGEKMKWGP